MVKRSIDFTKERTAKLNELIDLLGLAGVYGEIPKALDFAVTFTLEALKMAAGVTPRLPANERALYFKAVSSLQNEPKAPEKPQEPKI